METDVAVAAGQPKKRTFKKFSFRGVDLDSLLDMSTDELVKLFTARARRRYIFRIKVCVILVLFSVLVFDLEFSVLIESNEKVSKRFEEKANGFD